MPPPSPQIKAYEHETQRRRLQGHGMPRDTRCSRARGHHGRAPSIRTLAVIAFPHAPQRFSTVRVVFGLASAFDNDAERESFTKRLASQVGVAAKVVAVGCCEEEAGGLQASAVTIGPLPTAQADDVKAQLVACASDLEGTGKRLKVGVGRIGEPSVQTQRWSFCDAVLHAAVAAGAWPLRSCRWPLDAYRWPLRSCRWPLDAFRWPLRSCRWPLGASRWPLHSCRWPLHTFLWPLRSQST